MNLRQPQKLNQILVVVNWLLGLILSALVVKFTVEFFAPADSKALGYEIPAEPPKKPTSMEQFTLQNLAICWEANILKEAPKQTGEIPKPKEPKIKTESAIQLPFEYVGVVVHPTPQKSVAILMEKHSQKQILVRYGSVLPGTQFTVIEITSEVVKAEYSDTVVTLTKPKLWQLQEQAEGENLPRLGPRVEVINAAIIGENDTIVVLDPSLLAQYGFQKEDQIVAMERQRVYNLRQLRDVLIGGKKETVKLAVIRQRRIISLCVPTEVLSRLLQLPIGK